MWFNWEIQYSFYLSSQGGRSLTPREIALVNSYFRGPAFHMLAWSPMFLGWSFVTSSSPHYNKAGFCTHADAPEMCVGPLRCAYKDEV